MIGNNRNLALYDLPADPLNEISQRLLKTLGLPKDWAAAGWAIDMNKLAPDQQRIMDDGDPLNAWVQWWVEAGAPTAHKAAPKLVILQPGLLGRRGVEPLSVRTIQQCFDSGVSAIDAGFALVWGMPMTGGLTALGRVRSADAALAIAIDGCGAVLMTTKSELDLFRPQ